MKFCLIVFLFVQEGLHVYIANTLNYGRYDEETCHKMEITETKVLPLQPGNDARWQYATCVRVES